MEFALFALAGAFFTFCGGVIGLCIYHLWLLWSEE